MENRVHRCGIYWTEFKGDGIGCVQSGIRPALVVSNELNNEHSNVVTCIPLTSRRKAMYLPVHVMIRRDACRNGNLIRNSVALVEQITTVDISQVRELITDVTDKKTMVQIVSAIMIQVGEELLTDVGKYFRYGSK